MIERQVGRDHEAGPLVGGGDDVEQQLGPHLGGRDVAEFIQHQEVELPQAGPQAEREYVARRAASAAGGLMSI